MSTPEQPPVRPGPGYPPAYPRIDGPPPGMEYGLWYEDKHPTAPSALPVTPRKPHWWRDLGSGGQAAVLAVAIIGPVLLAAILFATLQDRGGPDDITFDVTSCQYSGDTLPAVTAEFTATNTGNVDHRLKIRWEYRDASGARIDTDTTYVTVPAGDTIRDSETTILPVAASGGTCGYSLD